MPKPLSPATLDIIEATAPVVAAKAAEIVPEMYRRLHADPAIAALFNMSHQAGDAPQHKALAGALIAYATHIRNPGVLAAALERIAQKHAGLQILPEHYPHVAEALMGAIGAVLGDALTPEIAAAWGEAYWFLADTLIAREEQIYTGSEQDSGGWRGWRRFRIAAKTPETAEICSFLLVPVDGGPVLRHRPGQYLSFRFTPTEGEEYRRNYSISSAPNGRDYRITVKREAGGRVSNWLHEEASVGTEVDVAPPAGEFFLDPAGKQEVVLLSAGVGLTPMIAMLDTFGGGDVPMIHIHAARSRAHHALPGSAKTATAAHVFYESPAEGEIAGRDFTAAGRIAPDWIVANTNAAIADYYICGPAPFMAAMIAGLRARAVPEDRIHYEFFGPASAAL